MRTVGCRVLEECEVKNKFKYTENDQIDQVNGLKLRSNTAFASSSVFVSFCVNDYTEIASFLHSCQSVVNLDQ